MPLYEYRCPRCEHVDALFRPLAQRNEPVYCEDCGLPHERTMMERIYSAQTYQPGRHRKNPPFPIPKWV